MPIMKENSRSEYPPSMSHHVVFSCMTSAYRLSRLECEKETASHPVSSMFYDANENVAMRHCSTFEVPHVQ